MYKHSSILCPPNGFRETLREMPPWPLEGTATRTCLCHQCRRVRAAGNQYDQKLEKNGTSNQSGGRQSAQDEPQYPAELLRVVFKARLSRACAACRMRRAHEARVNFLRLFYVLIGGILGLRG